MFTQLQEKWCWLGVVPSSSSSPEPAARPRQPPVKLGSALRVPPAATRSVPCPAVLRQVRQRGQAPAVPAQEGAFEVLLSRATSNNLRDVFLFPSRGNP